jgi:hypothetical protein
MYIIVIIPSFNLPTIPVTQSSSHGTSKIQNTTTQSHFSSELNMSLLISMLCMHTMLKCVGDQVYGKHSLVIVFLMLP